MDVSLWLWLAVLGKVIAGGRVMRGRVFWPSRSMSSRARSRRSLWLRLWFQPSLKSFFHVSRAVVVAGNFVSCNNCQRLQSVDLVERGKPFQPGLPAGFVEKRVNAVIDGIACNNQTDGWDVKTRRIVSVGMADSCND